MCRSFCLAAALLCALNCRSANADLIITVQDTILDVYHNGLSGTVDVLIDGTGSVSDLDYEFHITPIGSPASTLKFTDPQVLSLTQSDSNYVFDGIEDPFGAFTLTVSDVSGGTDNRLVGTDATELGSGNAATDPSNRLMVRLGVELELGGGQTTHSANNQHFLISVASATLSDPEDFGGTRTDPVLGGTNSGTISITNPEPTSLASLGVIGLLGCYFRRRKAKS